MTDDWRLVIGGTDFDWRAHLPMCRNFSAGARALTSRKAALNLAKSYDLLAKMADEALQEYRAGKAESLTNLNFALVIGDEDLPVSGRD